MRFSSVIFYYGLKAGGLLITGTEMTSQEPEITSPEPEIMSPEPEVMSWFKMASGGKNHHVTGNVVKQV